jgi:hypothetical protein
MEIMTLWCRRGDRSPLGDTIQQRHKLAPGTSMTIAYVGNNPPTAPGSGPAVFPVEDIHWAQAWAGVAPGWGDWAVRLRVSNDGGEAICVAPPGSTVERFVIWAPAVWGRQAVISWKEEPENGGVMSEIGRAANLRDALLFLCPLSRCQIEGLERDLAMRPTLPGLPTSG